MTGIRSFKSVLAMSSAIVACSLATMGHAQSVPETTAQKEARAAGNTTDTDTPPLPLPCRPSRT
ncbi:hypothetical protein [Sphingomonas aerolata]|uniref:hypothetical protein n=1 Tax=Sphingomonas aerolata TaxID=185951 RepID=UPI002FE3B387